MTHTPSTVTVDFRTAELPATTGAPDNGSTESTAPDEPAPQEQPPRQEGETPETDQQSIRAEAAFRAGAEHVVTAEFARKLERKRNAAERRAAGAEAILEAAKPILCNVSQLIQGFRSDPSLAPGEWSEFDESTFLSVGDLAKRIHELKP